ncbi:MAG: hypothetical protein V8R08_07695 [Coriobacteriales bacterium]
MAIDILDIEDDGDARLLELASGRLRVLVGNARINGKLVTGSKPVTSGGDTTFPETEYEDRTHSYHVPHIEPMK